MDAIQIALSVATIAASGVVSGVVTYRLNALRDTRRMRREKLEQLFRAHAGFTTQMEVSWIPYMAVMDGRIDYNAALQQTIKTQASEERHIDVIEMLVNLYFPNLLPGFQELLSIRDDSAAIISAHKNVYRDHGPHPSKALAAMNKVGDRLDRHRKQFRASMARLAQQLGAFGTDIA